MKTGFQERVQVQTSRCRPLNSTATKRSSKNPTIPGRRDLEHEFGKTMRYKAIRDLAAGDTGEVIQDLESPSGS